MATMRGRMAPTTSISFQPGAPLGSGDSLELPQLLELFQELLQSHELRLCMELLQLIRTSEPLAHATLQGDVRGALREFLQVRGNQAVSEDLGLRILRRHAHDQATSASKERRPSDMSSAAIGLDYNGNVPSAPSKGPEEGRLSRIRKSACDGEQIVAPERLLSAQRHSFRRLTAMSGSGTSRANLVQEKDGSRSGAFPHRTRGSQVSEEEEDDDDEDIDETDGLSDDPVMEFGRTRTEGVDANGEIRGQQRSCEKKLVIHPNSNGRLAWDCLGLFLIVTDSFCMPLAIAFDMEVETWWMWFLTVYFASDMLSQFFTGFFRSGVLIMRRRLIALNYMKTFFLMDICATVPWDIFLAVVVGSDSGGSNASVAKMARAGKMLRMFRLLRVVRLRDLLSKIEDLMSHSTLMVLSLFKTIMLFAVLCHWLACVWGYMGNPEKIGHHTATLPPRDMGDCEPGGPCENGIQGSPWVRRYGLEKHDSTTRYLVALQFSAGLLTGSDMGMSPAFWVERAYVIVMTFASFLICSVVLSKIVVLCEEFNAERSELTRCIRQAKTFMQGRKISHSLQSKVFRYLEHQHKASAQKERSGDGFLQQLSPWIRLEITESMNRSIILRHPFFLLLPRALLKQICGVAETVFCAPGDVVVQRGHRASSMLFLVAGRLKFNYGRKSIHANTRTYLEPPAWIEDMCLFKDMLRTHTIVSVTHVELLKIAKDALLTLLDEFPRAKRYYEDYQDRIMKGEATGLACSNCYSVLHEVQDCPELQGEASSENGEPAKGGPKIRRISALNRPPGMRSRLVKAMTTVLNKDEGLPTSKQVSHTSISTLSAPSDDHAFERRTSSDSKILRFAADPQADDIPPGHVVEQTECSLNTPDKKFAPGTPKAPPGVPVVAAGQRLGMQEAIIGPVRAWADHPKNASRSGSRPRSREIKFFSEAN